MEFAQQDEEVRERRYRLFWSYLSSADLTESREGREMGMPVPHRLHLAKINSRWFESSYTMRNSPNNNKQSYNYSKSHWRVTSYNPLECRISASLLSSYFVLSPFLSIFLFSFFFFICHATFISTSCYANLFGSRHIHISGRLYLNSLHWAELCMCQETLEMSRISYNVLYVVVLIVSLALTLLTWGACNTLAWICIYISFYCALAFNYTVAPLREIYIWYIFKYIW